MPTHEEAELAKIRARHARVVTNKDVASALWKIAEDYQSEPAKAVLSRPILVSRLPVLGRSVGIALNNHVPIPDKLGAFIGALVLRDLVWRLS
jgi:hypothetical protein